MTRSHEVTALTVPEMHFCHPRRAVPSLSLAAVAGRALCLLCVLLLNGALAALAAPAITAAAAAGVIKGEHHVPWRTRPDYQHP